MLRYALRRLLLAVPLLIGITFVSFTVIHLRQDHDGLRFRVLRHAGLLAGAPAHAPVRRPARLAADLGPALAQLGVSVVLAPAGGLREPPRAADHRRDLRRARRLLALH